MKKVLVLSVALVLVASTMSAQKIRKVSGDFAKVAGETELNVEYDYSDMAVGDYPKEAEYISYKKGEITKKDGAEKAQKWEDGWFGARKSTYEPNFEELANKRGNIVVAKNNNNAKYTLILKTTFTEPGWNVGVMKRPASLNVEYIFVEKNNPSVEVARLTAAKIPGSEYGGYDFDVSSRVKESYAKAGKMLAAFFKDNAPKKKK